MIITPHKIANPRGAVGVKFSDSLLGSTGEGDCKPSLMPGGPVKMGSCEVAS